VNHGIWLPGLIAAVAGALTITWAVWPLRSRRRRALPGQLALGRLEDATGRAQEERNDDNGPGGTE
jgi:hypothetical protein